MKMRRGWYLRWADDPMETNWLGTCPTWLASMRGYARRSGRKLIETPVRVMMPKNSFCLECQKFTTH